jgi:glucokinase
MADNEFDLVADIGGTNARFALHRRGTRAEFSGERVFACADFPRFEDALAAYRADCGASFTHAAIAIANPVCGDAIRMTNHHWAFSIDQARRELGLKRLMVINDFTALALSIPLLPTTELSQVGGTGAVPNATIGVIGPGTGLGVSGLVWSGSRWLALSGEGGHVSYSPRNAREWAMSEQLRKRHNGYLSFERVVSGPGLRAIYEAYCEVDGIAPQQLTPAEVAEKALAGQDARFSEVFDTFCAALGCAAGNLALTLGARGGVFIGGGIVPRWGDKFSQSTFREAFESKGRFKEYLAPIPVYVIHARLPALIGAASVLAE